MCHMPCLTSWPHLSSQQSCRVEVTLTSSLGPVRGAEKVSMYLKITQLQNDKNQNLNPCLSDSKPVLFLTTSQIEI